MEMITATPADRIRTINDSPINLAGEWVIYWMIAARRTRFNFALERAADWSRHLGRPLLIVEALRCDYPWASDRLHRFLLEGMADNRRALRHRPVLYYPYVEPDRGDGRGLVEALADRAAVVVTDDFPTFFLPAMVQAAAARVTTRFEAIDGNGLVPMSISERPPATAYGFRRLVQKRLLDHLEFVPLDDPLFDVPAAGVLPVEIVDRWPPASDDYLSNIHDALTDLPIDHKVTSAETAGGMFAADAALQRFLDRGLERYAHSRNRPDDDATSGLSPYLHFGHVSSHQVFLEIMRRSRWSPEDLVPPANGRRSGWWGVGESVEGFLDQLITWRELGFHFCHHHPKHDQYESIPDWARRTLDLHAGDPREHVYSVEEFEGAATHDALWNAAQNQLRREGRLHNYLRMLWGKKILEWSSEPREALDIMLELNNKYALDGRDPNSVTGICWVLGRHDRAWGPERPIFGTVRYMSSANTAKKVPVREYMERYS